MALAETRVVTVRAATDPTATVGLTNLKPYSDEKTFTVQAQANGLSAQIDRVTFTPWDRPQPDDFFAQLATDYAGWAGIRTWRSNHLVIDARFHSGGHVALSWTLQATTPARTHVITKRTSPDFAKPRIGHR